MKESLVIYMRGQRRKTPQKRTLKNMTVKERDALNNIGLPQLAQSEELTKDDIKTIIKTIGEFDKKYIDNSFKESNTRKTLINFINNYCVVYRWYSLYIK